MKSLKISLKNTSCSERSSNVKSTSLLTTKGRLKILQNQSGAVLIVVLWVTVLLTVMVNGFIAMVRTEARSVSNYKQEIQAYNLAKSGFNIALGKFLSHRPAISDGTEENIEKWRSDGRPYNISLEGGSVEVSVTDEGGKINVNKISRENLVRALSILEIKGAERDTIADSILDWIDENNFHHLNGAEDDYYKSLPDPYEAKDAPLDTIDELMWVKGITADFFYGEEKEKDVDNKNEEKPLSGLSDIFTVYDNSMRVNINTAPWHVLLYLPAMDEKMAQSIITEREKKEFQDMGDFARAGGKLAPMISKMITFASPGIYTILSKGIVDESPITHTLKAVIEIDKHNDYSILYWKDHDLIIRSAS